MTLKYKLGDVVVLGENVGRDYREYFTPGVLVRVEQLCDEGNIYDEHYTIYRIDGEGGAWWVQDSEINHEVTEALQKPNETAYIVGKEQAVSDDNVKEVRTPALQDNTPQTALQSAIENTYSAVYSSVSVFHKSNAKEAVKITIDGKFLVFQQERDGDIQEILLDFNAVGAVFSVANELIMQYKEKK